MPPRPEDIRVIVATDCGSTTTKAILIERQPDGSYRQTHRGEAPTTVEAPFEDVTRGVRNALQELAELSGRVILDDHGELIRPAAGARGVDVYVSTSSAGGGLQMVVAGVVRSMTAESAARAALGAGAIVMETLASNDRRPPHEQIQRIRHLRPDMLLLSGGVDGGTVEHVVALAELLAAADPKPRLGIGYRLPVIYAGNREARPYIRQRLEPLTDLCVVDNLRPTLEEERLAPARDRIHDLFMEHVMQQAPGYRQLMAMTDAPIKPTPGAVGDIIRKVAEREDIDVLGVDIGGATTDVFSVFQGQFNRTVSANLGMSYSVGNVLAEAGLEAILRWLPFDLDAGGLRNAIKNKMIRPTSIPETPEDLMVEQAVAREALRLSLVQHVAFAVSLKGVQQERGIGEAFEQEESGGSLVNLLDLDLLVGSGGVLSHAPRRHQSMLMLIDAFLPEGVTRIAVDSIFMMPHLGVLADLHPAAAAEVFDKDCLIHLGTCIAPAGIGKPGKPCLRIEGVLPDGGRIDRTFAVGDLALVSPPDIPAEESAGVRRYHPRAGRVTLHPARGVDVGAGPGKSMTREITDGVVGVVVDCRGRRPFQLPALAQQRTDALLRWYRDLRLYDDEALQRCGVHPSAGEV